MPLPAPRRGSGRPAVVAALVTGGVALLVAAIVIGLAFVRGTRPEEGVARSFVEAFLAGDGAAAYAHTTPGYQAVVFVHDLVALSGAVHVLAGEGARIDILGSERTPGSDPLHSLVGYEAAGDIGRIRGVVTVVELEEGVWRVRDVSYRFPDAPPGATAALDALTRELNEQIARRLAERD